MSFSGMVKEELSKNISLAHHCQRAELAAFFSAFGKISRDAAGDLQLVIHTENEPVIRKCFTILRKSFSIDTDIQIRDNSPSKKGKAYQIEIRQPEQIEQLLQGTKMEADETDGGTLYLSNLILVQKSCCKRAFIRGAFLSSGSMSDPSKGYNFEIVCPDEGKAVQLQEMICSFHINAKIVRRKKAYVVYVKEGAQIVDMMAIMEANVSLMNLENIRIIKEVRNTINRKVNCDTANINKTVNAACKQKEDIELIDRKIGIQNLNEGLAELAELRLQNPEATLKKLGMMLSPQVGKSGVNHRLRKLSMIAEELRENEEELL